MKRRDSQFASLVGAWAGCAAFVATWILAFRALAVLPGGGFALTRYTIDNGGVMRSAAGDSELSGTIGQPDAGVLVGGEFALSGGFWFELAPTDCNGNGMVDLLDHDWFTRCLTGPDGGVPDGCQCFDVDRSGAIDLRDFAAAQSAHDSS